MMMAETGEPPLRLLVVERGSRQADELRRGLEERGFLVDVARDGEEAYRRFVTRRYDLVVTEVDLARVTGFELCRRIRASSTRAEVPLLIVTGRDARDDRQAGLDAGADGFLVKPVDAETVSRHIRILLERDFDQAFCATGRGRVLIVDGSSTEAERTRLILEAAGFEADVAADGEEALATIGGERNDVLLTDVVLRPFSGHELCRRVKADPATGATRVVLHSARREMRDVMEGLECGADNYVTKPAETAELVRAIAEVIARTDGQDRRPGVPEAGATIRLDDREFRIDAGKGQILGYLTSTFENLERAKRAETASLEAGRILRESSRLLQSSLDALSAALAITDAQGRIVAANRAWVEREVAGPFGEGAVVGASLLDGAEGSSGGAELRREIGRLLDRSSAESIEREIACGDGAGRRWYSIRVSAFVEDGLLRLLVSQEDITARRRAEAERERLLKQVQTEGAFLDAVVRSAPVGVVIAEAPTGRIILANDEAERVCGQRLLADDIEAYQRFEGRRRDGRRVEAHEWPVARSIAGDETVTGEEIQFVRPDGVVTPILVSSRPILGRDGRLIAAVATFVDISEREELQSQLVQSQKMEGIGQLAGGIAHDFNNILSGIIGFSELALGHAPPDSKLEKYLRQVRSSGEHAAILTRQLLAFSRKQHLEPRLLDVGEVVAESQVMLARLIGENIQIKLAGPDELPAVMIDPAQLSHVVVNLAVNARDAMPDGGTLLFETSAVSFDEERARGDPEVEVGDYVRLAVSDTGRGMPPEVIARIFEPFFTTKAEGKGTGLGMSMVHGFVKQSGGFIRVYSEPGAGTVFKLYFPQAAGDVEAGRAEEVERAEPPGGTETILVVEDEDVVRDLGRAILEGAGYAVIEAGNAEGALRICERGEPFDLLISDVMLPGMSGRELTRMAREIRGPDLPVVYMSGYTESTVHERGGPLLPGATFIEKPLTQRALLERVRSVLDARTPARAEGKSVHGATVLVVDDSLTVRGFATEVLDGAGFAILEASGPAEALSLSRSHPAKIDLLLTDVVMPEIKGPELARRLGEERADMGVLYMSGYTGETAVEEGGLPPGAAYLSKPFTPEQLVHAVESALRGGRG